MKNDFHTERERELVAQRRIVREKERKEITGVPQSSWYKKMQRGEAPRSIALGPKAVGWYDDELYEWNADPLGWPDKHNGAVA